MPATPINSRLELLAHDPFGDDIFQFKENQPCLVDLTTLQRLYLQTIPKEIRNNIESTWVAIASMGRNNPFYHFTGSEDTIEFEITWYCQQESRQDVIKKCKWLESLTKNDGYDNKPPEVKFIFGDLYKDSKFIVTKAPYSLGLFSRPYMMMPTLAIQQITLKRITEDNRKRTDILKYTT